MGVSVRLWQSLSQVTATALTSGWL